MYQNKSFRIALCLIFGLLFSNLLISQKNFIQGKITTTDGTVIDGEINYKNWLNNPNNVSFKENGKNEIKKYTPKEIREFEVADEKYIGALVDVEISKWKENLSSNKELNLVKENIFLRTVIEGEKSLYHYRNTEKSLFYIKEKNDYTLLGYKKFINSKQIIKENKSFISQLSQYLSDCPKIQKEFSSLNYKIKALEKLFNKYYDCTSQQIDFQKKAEKTKIRFGFVGGISMSKLNFLSESGFLGHLAKVNYNNGLVISAGLTHKITFPRNLGKISLFNELMISTPYKNEGLWEDFASEHNYIRVYPENSEKKLKPN